MLTKVLNGVLQHAASALVAGDFTFKAVNIFCKSPNLKSFALLSKLLIPSIFAFLSSKYQPMNQECTGYDIPLVSFHYLTAFSIRFIVSASNITLAVTGSAMNAIDDVPFINTKGCSAA